MAELLERQQIFDGEQELEQPAMGTELNQGVGDVYPFRSFSLESWVLDPGCRGRGTLGRQVRGSREMGVLFPQVRGSGE